MSSALFSPLNFIKMHGLGNDFVFIDHRVNSQPISADHVRYLADRRRGVGCDQVIILEPSAHQADVFMRIFNADGSEVGACGNATRCLGAFLTRETGKKEHTVETSRGLLTTLSHGSDVEVNMGRPFLHWRDIPLAHEVDPLFLPISVPGYGLPVAVGMGNPHLVFFVPCIKDVMLEKWGEELARHPLFPQGANVEFVEIKSRTCVRMRVWERGAGVTQSCASGACAVVVAGFLRGELDNRVVVELDGGNLTISYEETVVMRGAVSFVFSGTLDESLMLYS